MPEKNSETKKLAVLLGYWIEHNREHIAENRAWAKKADDSGLRDAADSLKKAIELSEEANRRLEHARGEVEEALEKGTRAPQARRHEAHQSAGSHAHPAGLPEEHGEEHRHVHRHISFHQIGTIRTPYRDGVPRDLPGEDSPEAFRIVVNEEFREGLAKLDSFSYIFVLSYLDRPKDRSGRLKGPCDCPAARPDPMKAPPELPRGEAPMTVTPSRGGGVEVGVFSSRSPDRPNPIGLSIVRVLGVSGNVVRVSPIDVLDETPLLDIKPYFGGSDSKPDAGDGWLGAAPSSM